MQNYFGIALRSNVGNLAAMKSTCMALMYHTLQIPGINVKRVNKTTPATTNQTVIYPLMSG